MNNRHKIFVCKLEERTRLLRFCCGWDNDIIVELKDLLWKSGFIWLMIGASGWFL
jgi:hypothetical protein